MDTELKQEDPLPGEPQVRSSAWLERITRYVLSMAMSGLGLVAAKADEVWPCVFCFAAAVLMWWRAGRDEAL